MRSTRPLAMLAAATLGVTLLSTAPAGAAPARATSYDPAPVATGAGWLAGQLTNGLVHNDQYKFDDIGLSIDVAIGLLQADEQRPVARRITQAVAKNVASYTSFGSSVYAGATAKAAVLAQVQRKDPRSFGGVDLIAQLEGRVATAAPIAGRIQDAYDPTDPYGGDFANVIGQTFAVGALRLAKSPQAGAVEAFFRQQQCDAGYFRQDFTSDKTRADQSCQGAPRAERGASTDATALALSELFVAKGPKARAALKKAVAWLVDTQRPDGSFTDTGKATGAANANSTGVAGLILGVLGQAYRNPAWAQAARRAATWVRNLQVPKANPCSGKLAGEVGAIAYDDEAYGTAQGFGITKKTSDQWRRASSQAVGVLQYAPLASGTFTASGPATVRSGQMFGIDLTGVAPGQRVCVSSGASTYEFESGLEATTHVSFAVGGSGARSYHVWLGNRSRVVSVRVVG